jgi:putative ABC transport system ATP-binding protein
MTILADIAKAPNRGVLVVTHDPRLVSFADRIIHIEDGHIVREQTRDGNKTLKDILGEA